MTKSSLSIPRPPDKAGLRDSVSPEQVAGVDLLLYIIEAAVIAVGNNGLTPLFERLKVVYHLAAKEGRAVLQRRLVDDDGRALGLDPLHDALNGGLPEVVRVRLHGQAVDADDARLLLPCIVLVLLPIAVVARHLKHPVGDKVLAGAVGLHDGLDEVLGHVGVVGEKLLGVFGQTVAAVAEAGIIIMCADAGVEADALDDLLGVKALHLGIGVQLVEEGDAERQICVCKQFDGLCLCEAHEEGLDIFLDGPLLQQMGEGVGRFHKAVVLHIRTHDDAAGVEIVIQRFGLPQKLRAEDDVPALIFFPNRSREAHRDGGLDDHDGLGVHLHHQLDDCLHRRGIEEVLPAVVVGRGGNDHEVRVPVGRFPVQRSGQVEILFRKVSFNVVILNGGLFVVDLPHFLRHDVHSGDTVVLAQQGGDGQADIAP